MFISPYDTKTASWVKVQPIQADMKTAKIERRLTPVSVAIPGIPDPRASGPSDNPNLFYLASGPTGNAQETAFSNPLTFTDTLGRLNIVADMRTMLSYEDGVMSARNRTAMMDCQQLVVRMKAMWLWSNGRANDLLSISSLGMEVYARWLTEGVARRLGLNYDTIPRMMAYSAYFYYTQFYDASDIDPTMAMSKIIEQTNIKSAVVMSVIGDIIEQNVKITGLDSFIANAVSIVGAEELTIMDAKYLIAASGSAWIGAKADEATGIAIEYPPYFLSILYGSMNSNLYKNTAVGKILDRGEFRKIKEGFARNFTGIINE